MGKITNFICVIAIIGFHPACSDVHHDAAQKTGDGTRASNHDNKKSGSETHSSTPSSGAVKSQPQAKGGIGVPPRKYQPPKSGDEFVYRPDPRLIEQMKKPTGPK